MAKFIRLRNCMLPTTDLFTLASLSHISTLLNIGLLQAFPYHPACRWSSTPFFVALCLHSRIPFIHLPSFILACFAYRHFALDVCLIISSTPFLPRRSSFCPSMSVQALIPFFYRFMLMYYKMFKKNRPYLTTQEICSKK